MGRTISVIMGIYNCAPTLPAAVESIVNQTYTDWELIMCDDGSRDDTYAVAESYRQQYPEKIILIKNERNMGLNFTLNRCLSCASGDYIARMDGDDLCDPLRFEKELQVLEEDSQLAVVSTSTSFFDENGTWGKSIPKEYPDKMDCMRGTPFCHAPSMIRRKVIEEIGGYTDDSKYLRVEDYDLWIRIYAAGYRGKNIQQILYHVRDDQNAVQRRKFRYRINESRVVCKAVKLLRLPIYGYLFALIPIIKGFLPLKVYQLLHRNRLTGE